MRLHLLGVRGSTTAPGPEFVRYGGHTSCVAVWPGEEDRPTLLLDAGTGVRDLGHLLGDEPFRGTLALSHLHWDHMQGIPFSRALDHDDAEVRVLVPAQGGSSGRDLLAQAMAPPAFPITPEGLRGRWTFEAVEPGVVAVDGARLVCAEIAHKGGRTFGWRVDSADGSSLAYLPDHAPDQGMSEGGVALVSGADLLLHDAQFLEAERRVADDYGHATIGDAVHLAVRLSVGALMLFHHSPGRTDEQLDGLVADAQAVSTVPVLPAVQGASHPVDSTSAPTEGAAQPTVSGLR